LLPTLMGGLGGFGGAGIGNAIAGSNAAASTLANAAPGATGTGASISNQAATAGEIASNAAPGAGVGAAPMQAMPGLPGGASPSTLAENFDAARGVVSNDIAPTAQQFGGSTGVTTLPPKAAPGLMGLGTQAGRDAFVQRLGGTGPNASLIAAGKVAMPVGMAALSGIEPPKPPEEEKYDPNFRLDLSGDSGLRFYAEGGDVNETPDPGSNPIQDAQEAQRYGLGGLAYAEGGDVQNFAGGGYTLKDNSGNVIERGKGGFGAMINAIKNNQGLFADNKNLNLGGSGVNLGGSGVGGSGTYSPAQFEQMYNAYNQNRNLMSSFMVNPNKRPEVSPEQTQFNKMMQQSGPRVGGDPFGNLLYGRNLSDEQKAFNQQLQDYNKARMDYYKEQSPLKGFGGIYAGGAGTGGIGVSKPLDIWQGNTSMPSGSGLFAGSSQALFAKGGYLDGPGDGMSDSIPATIADKQPARLADGEFVVPADVVSHLGNGSTKAGAQRLYAMMDKVRHARTGTTKQGKQINPKKYLPA